MAPMFIPRTLNVELAKMVREVESKLEVTHSFKVVERADTKLKQLIHR